MKPIRTGVIREIANINTQTQRLSLTSKSNSLPTKKAETAVVKK